MLQLFVEFLEAGLYDYIWLLVVTDKFEMLSKLIQDWVPFISFGDIYSILYAFLYFPDDLPPRLSTLAIYLISLWSLYDITWFVLSFMDDFDVDVFVGNDGCGNDDFWNCDCDGGNCDDGGICNCNGDDGSCDNGGKMNFLIGVNLKLPIHYQFHHHGWLYWGLIELQWETCYVVGLLMVLVMVYDLYHFSLS